MTQKTFTIDEAHQFFGIDFNNKIFILAEKEFLNADEQEEIVALAHASFLHWLNYSGHQKVNTQRTLYMLAKAYIVVEHKSKAKEYAEKCYQFTQEYKTEMQDFDIAYADEIMARSAALNRDENIFKKHCQKVEKSLLNIANPEDLKWLKKDFENGKWFGWKN